MVFSGFLMKLYHGIHGIVQIPSILRMWWLQCSSFTAEVADGMTFLHLQCHFWWCSVTASCWCLVSGWSLLRVDQWIGLIHLDTTFCGDYFMIDFVLVSGYTRAGWKPLFTCAHPLDQRRIPAAPALSRPATCWVEIALAAWKKTLQSLDIYLNF